MALAVFAIAFIGWFGPRGLASIAFIGWFGPRGLASIAFGLTALVSLEEAGVGADGLTALVSLEEAGIGADVLAQTVTWTVLLSVVLHGLTAAPLAARFGRIASEAGGIEEVEVSARSRWVIHNAE